MTIRLFSLRKLTFKVDHSIPSKAYGSVRAHTNFDADWDDLNNEMAIKIKSVGEVTIVNILTNHSNNRILPSPTREGPKRNLKSALKSAFSGHLESVIWGPLKTPARYDASRLKASMKDLGADEYALIEIICSRTNQELEEINRVYKEMYQR